MEFKLINLLPQNWLHALGATLFHSLWLGVILSLVCGVVMFATRKASASVRYNLLIVCLFLFVGAIGFTFYTELQKPVSANLAGLANEIEINLQKADTKQPVISDFQHQLYAGLSKLLNIWNNYAYQIVLVWILIICGKSIQLVVGLNGVYHLRNNQTYHSGKQWDDKLAMLANKLGIHQQVKMMQSGLAQMPLVVGHFKPLILIPLGLINGLSNAEVEAILLHELAHIKRRDYLVNLLQSFIEIVFFFNPAVLWVSQLIKTEREHCCDDLAIACVNDRKNYVKALIFCQEFKQCAPAYAMGITSKKGSLLHRASRMLFNTNSTLNKMEKTILTIALVSVVFCTAAFKSVAFAANTVSKKEMLAAIQVVQDTTKKDKSVAQLEAEIERKLKLAEKKSNEKGKVKKGSELSNQITDRNHTEEASQQAKEDAKQAVIDRKQAEEDRKQAILDAKQAVIDAKQAEEDAKQAGEDAKLATADAIQARKDSEFARRNINGAKIPRPPKPPKPAVPATPPLPASPPAPPATPRNYGTITKSSSERVVSTKSVTNGDGKDYTAQINKELLGDGIISTTNKLSYKLNKSELIVNGVKQNDQIQKKYKQKYLKNDGHSLMYNYQIENHSANF